MNNNRLLIFAFSFAFISTIIALFLYLDKRQPLIQETLSFYPIDQSVEFEEGLTSIKLLALENKKEFTLEWTTYSSLNKKTFLRHDFSLLFEDGKLKDKMSQLEENKQNVSMNIKIKGNESGHFEAVTFHHGEIHYPNDDIKSKQIITSDELYVIDSPLTPFHAFKVAKTIDEAKGKNVLDKIVQQNLNYIWNDLLKHYQVNTNNYTIVPLTDLDEFSRKGIEGFSIEQSEKITAAIIENIYSHYFFGIPKGDGTYISPLGSTIPIILIPKEEKDHLMILFRTENGKNVQLLKKFSL